MSGAYGTATATIQATKSLSGTADLGFGSLIGLLMPSAFTGDVLTFQVSIDGGVSFADFEVGGNEYQEPTAPNRYVPFGDLFAGISNIKVRSGTSESPVDQAANASIILIGSNSTVFPNPRRTIVVPQPGWLRAFPNFAALETDVITFDISRLIAPALGTDPAETIESVSFSMAPAGPYGAADPSPSSRIIGSAGIEGGQVSQHVGNWQTGIPGMWYTATATVTTSRDDTLIIQGIVPVGMPTGWRWSDQCGGCN